MLAKLDSLNFEIYFVVLYLEDTSKFEQRIKRDKYEYQKFDVKSSIRQQEEYLKLADEIEKKSKNIKVVRISTDKNGNYKEKIEEKFGYLFK